jgi:hypothetical protein
LYRSTPLHLATIIQTPSQRRSADSATSCVSGPAAAIRRRRASRGQLHLETIVQQRLVALVNQQRSYASHRATAAPSTPPAP